MGFYEILCPRPSSAPEDSYCIIILSVVSRRLYHFIMYIMSQSPLVIWEWTHFHPLRQQVPPKDIATSQGHHTRAPHNGNAQWHRTRVEHEKLLCRRGTSWFQRQVDEESRKGSGNCPDSKRLVSLNYLRHSATPPRSRCHACTGHTSPQSDRR